MPTREHCRIVTLLMVALAALYMLTYSGQIEIADQLQYFDAVGSVAQFGDTRLDLAMWQPDSLPRQFPPRDPLPLKTTIAEPAFIYAAAPLFWLAERVEGIGLLHTTYLFNILMTALICGAFYALAVTLGFTARVAVMGALGLGVGTILLPYSQTFFREPLLLCLMLLAVILLERWRTHPRGVWRLLGAAALLTVAYFTKDALILALPALIVWMLPPSFWRWQQVGWRRHLSPVLLIGLLLTVCLIAFTDVLALLPSRLALGRFMLETEYTHTALHTYLFSLGGSVWGTSPILLLGIIGGILRWRQGDQRTVWAVVLVVIGYTLGYALLRGEEWFGGTIWPQRFLLPAIPFAMLLTLPVLEALPTLKNAPLRRIGAALIALLVVYSLWWQYHGVAHRWDEYSRLTYALSDGGLAYWSPGFNDWRYIRPVILTQSALPLNFAWVRTGAWGFPVLFGGIIALCVLWSWRGWRRVWLTPALLLIALAVGLRAIYIDPAYLGDQDALHAMLPIIEANTESGDILLLSDREYSNFFLNYGKTRDHVRVLTLPFHPGERGSCEQALTLTSDNPEMLLADLTTPLIHHLAQHTLAQHNARLWVLAASSPEIPCVVRPVERLMSRAYYRAQEIRTAPTARLIAYHTTPAPDAYGFYGADVAVNLRFTTLETHATSLDLIGVQLPRGTHYSAGEWLPLSLYWQAQASISRDYTVAWYLAQADGVKAQGEDSWFGGTFAPSSLWQPNVPIWDHRALRLPADLPAGTYELWVKVYWQDVMTGAITDLTLQDSAPAQTIGVLPVTVTITTPD